MGAGGSTPYAEESDNALRARCHVEIEALSIDDQILVLHRIATTSATTTWTRDPKYRASWIGVAWRYELVSMLDLMQELRDTRNPPPLREGDELSEDELLPELLLEK